MLKLTNINQFKPRDKQTEQLVQLKLAMFVVELNGKMGAKISSEIEPTSTALFE